MINLPFGQGEYASDLVTCIVKTFSTVMSFVPLHLNQVSKQLLGDQRYFR